MSIGSTSNTLLGLDRYPPAIRWVHAAPTRVSLFQSPAPPALPQQPYFKQSHRQPLKFRHQQNCLAALKQRLHLLGWNAAVELDAVGETGLVHERLARDALVAVADQVGFNLAGRLAGVDEGVHHTLDTLLPLHHAAAVDHEIRLIRKTELGGWQCDAAEDHLRVGGGQALAQLLGQALEDGDDAAAVSFRGEGFGDTPVI